MLTSGLLLTLCLRPLPTWHTQPCLPSFKMIFAPETICNHVNSQYTSLDTQHDILFLPRGMTYSLALKPLTLWEQGYDIFILWNQPKTSSCRLPYQHHSFSADYARELFKGSNGSASLLVCPQKKIFWLEVADFWEWHHKWSSFWAILAHVTWPRAQPLGQSISLKFLLEIRLKSESFDRLSSISGSKVMT